MQRGWVVSPHYRTAIDAVIAARQEAGISQRELARRLSKSPSFVNKIESLERRLDVLEFLAIADALGVDAAGLIRCLRLKLPEKIEI
jgi:transcriptional regulator with XRE-family HTH domain